MTVENENVDELLASLDQPSPERPMSSEEAPQQQAEAQPEQPSEPVWNGSEWKFSAGGKEIVPDSRDKILQWASQGYNYSQRMGELNKTWAQKQQELEAKYKGFDRYGEIDQYAKQNPDWWKHVESSWQSRGPFQPNQPQLDPSLESVLRPLQEKLGSLEQFTSQLQQERLEAEKQKEDQALDTEVESIRKSYPNIDLRSIDETGESLELRVLKHMQQIGTTSFRAGFRDYLHDRLVEEAKAQSKVQEVKTAQQKAKAGILGETPAPVKGVKPAQNVKAASYDQLAQEALREFGISP